MTRRGQGHKERRCFFYQDIVDGSVFGGCSCGIPYTDGIPCHHMVAVVKLSRIEGLTATNSMPTWWSTECWRKQYPANTNVICNFDMDVLRTFPEDSAMRYCPPYAAASKAGRPKNDKRIKSPLEGKKKIKSIVSTQEDQPEAMVSTQEDQLEAMDSERKMSAAPVAPRRGKRRTPD